MNVHRPHTHTTRALDHGWHPDFWTAASVPRQRSGQARQRDIRYLLRKLSRHLSEGRWSTGERDEESTSGPDADREAERRLISGRAGRAHNRWPISREGPWRERHAGVGRGLCEINRRLNTCGSDRRSVW